MGTAWFLSNLKLLCSSVKLAVSPPSFIPCGKGELFIYCTPPHLQEAGTPSTSSVPGAPWKCISIEVPAFLFIRVRSSLVSNTWHCSLYKWKVAAQSPWTGLLGCLQEVRGRALKGQARPPGGGGVPLSCLYLRCWVQREGRQGMEKVRYVLLSQNQVLGWKGLSSRILPAGQRLLGQHRG